MSEAGTIDLPGAGPVKKTYVYVGAAVVAGILGYAWWARWRASDGEGAVIDPGFEDYTGGLQTGTPGTTTPGIGWQPLPPADEDDLPPTTNAKWTVRAVDYMQNLGFDPQLVATVLGKYLARVPVTNTEADIIRTVEGAIGKPPVGEYRIIMVGTPPPAPPPPPAPNPPPPPPAQAPTHVSVPGPSLSLYTWVDQLNRDYPGLNLSFTKMFGNFMGDPTALNPGARKYIKWLGTGTKTPIFNPNWSGRTPPLGIPPMRIR